MSNVYRITPYVQQCEAPTLLRNLPGWLVWRFEPNGEKKPRKIPYYVNGNKRYGEQGDKSDLTKLATFDVAQAVMQRKGFDGIGFAPLEPFGICALDFDNCVNPDGTLHPQVDELLMDSYAEYSPSGKGVRIFFEGNLGNGKNIRDVDFGMEVFSTKGFVTFTGNTLPITELLGNTDTVAPVNDQVLALYKERFKREEQVEQIHTAGDPVGLTDAQITTCLAALPTDLHYDDWLKVGMAIHCETAGEGFELWEEWSLTSGKYSSREYNEDRWRSFGRGSGPSVTGRSLVHLAGQHGCKLTLNGPAGADEFEELVDKPDPNTSPIQRFGVQPAHEFAAGAPPTWIIKDVIPDAELIVLYGASGAGKSFIALDMAASIALGTPWRGKRVKQHRVVYVAAEGAGGFRKRLNAYAQHHDIPLASIDIGVIHAAPNMMEKQDAVDIVKAIRAWGGAQIIIVDTFAQVMPGANENAGEDVGKALTHCKRIHEATGAMIMLIHHAGKDSSKGARGWSGLRAAADAELEVVRDGNARALKLTKSKDGEDGQIWGFALDPVQIGVDEDLDPVTSCVVVDAEVPVGGLSDRKLGPVEKIVNDVVQEMAKAQTEGIEVKHIISEAMKAMTAPTDGKRDQRKTRIRRAIESLCTGDDAPYWLQDDGTISIC